MKHIKQIKPYDSLTLATKVLLVFFISVIVSYFYQGITTLPTEGDSIAYHIPIATSVLNGDVLNPVFPLGYYPANAEVILSLLMLLGIPINIYNIVGLMVLFVLLFKLGSSFALSRNMAATFAVSICTLHTMVRWLNTQIIDIWFAALYVFVLLLLQKPVKSFKYFLLLGIAFGFLIGAKYSGPMFAVPLILLYGRSVRKFITFGNMIAFLVPIIFIGCLWYVRNFVLTGNPAYPQPVLGLSGMPNWNIFAYHVWEAVVYAPLKFMNALLAEFMLWPLLTLGSVVYYFTQKKQPVVGRKLLLLGFINAIIFLFLPTSFNYNIIVSSFRYSYVAFIPFVLFVFLYIQYLKKEEYLVLFAAANIFFLPSLAYRPKLIVLAIAVYILLEYLSRNENMFNRQ